MSTSKNDILQGTLTLLVLKTLASSKRMHGYAITTHVQRVSDDLLRVEEGSLYPALHRMEQEGWLKSEWGVTEKNREARSYSLTAKGRKQLALEEEELGALHRGCRPGAPLRLTRTRKRDMSWLRRLINTVRPARLQRDIDRELAFHITERADDLRAGGLSDEEARRRARIQFGSPSPSASGRAMPTSPASSMLRCATFDWPCAACGARPASRWPSC